MPASKFKAALFDLDGTLVDSGRLVAQSAIDSFMHFGLPVPTHADVIAYMGIPIEVYFPKLAGADVFAQHDAKAVFADYRTRFKVMVESGRLEAFSGIPEILADLKAQGIAVGIVTSKLTEPAVHSCEFAGIAQYIDAYVGSDMVTGYKPAPDTVLKCLSLLGLEAGPDIAVIGDAEGDMGMGSSAGGTICGVTWGAHDAARLGLHNPACIADTRAQLRAFLAV